MAISTDFSAVAEPWKDSPILNLDHSEDQITQEKPFSPHFPNSISHEIDEFQTGETDLKDVQNLSFQRDADELMHQLSLQSVCSPSPPLHQDSICEDGFATARFPTKREVQETGPYSRSKSSSRLGRTESTLPPGKEKDLMDAFRKLLQEKLHFIGNFDDVIAQKSVIFEQFRNTFETVKRKGVDRSGFQVFIAKLSDPERFHDELTQAQTALHKQKQLRRNSSLNWMQQQLQKEKEKLARGMAKFARFK